LGVLADVSEEGRGVAADMGGATLEAPTTGGEERGSMEEGGRREHEGSGEALAALQARERERAQIRERERAEWGLGVRVSG
jgi:hypothetical protein